MAVVQRQSKKGTRYRVVVRDEDGRQRTIGTFGTLREAKRSERAGFKTHQPIYPTAKRGKQTVTGYAWPWLEAHSLSGHARETYGNILRSRVIPEIGDTILTEVTPHTIRNWFRRMEAEGASGALLAKVKTVASAMFQTAAEDGLLPANPVRGIRIKKDVRKRRKALTAEEYRRLLEVLEDPWKLIVRTIVESGIRYEEAVALRGTDIKGSDIHVQHVLTELRNPTRFVLEDRTKTGEGRIVRVSPELAAKIREAGSGFVFTWDGSHFRGERFRRTVWRPALEAAGIDPSITPRDLRRTHATLLRSGGADLETVRMRLGHATIAVTDRYLAERAECQDKALEALSVALSAA